MPDVPEWPHRQFLSGYLCLMPLSLHRACMQSSPSLELLPRDREMDQRSLAPWTDAPPFPSSHPLSPPPLFFFKWQIYQCEGLSIPLSNGLGCVDDVIIFSGQCKEKKEKSFMFISRLNSWSDVLGRSNLHWCLLPLSIFNMGCKMYMEGLSSWSLAVMWIVRRNLVESLPRRIKGNIPNQKAGRKLETLVWIVIVKYLRKREEFRIQSCLQT